MHYVMRLFFNRGLLRKGLLSVMANDVRMLRSFCHSHMTLSERLLSCIISFTDIVLISAFVQIQAGPVFSSIPPA